MAEFETQRINPPTLNDSEGRDLVSEEKEIFANTIADWDPKGEGPDAVADIRRELPVIRKFDAELAKHLEAFCVEAEETFEYVAGRKS